MARFPAVVVGILAAFVLAAVAVFAPPVAQTTASTQFTEFVAVGAASVVVTAIAAAIAN